jgi:predicted nucleic acid-binding protein
MKAVIDSMVFFRAMLGRHAKTASRHVVDLMIDGRIQVYTCDALMGEMYRHVKEDKILRTIDPVYFQQYMNRIDEWIHYVRMKDLEQDKKRMNELGNDWYLIAIARNVPTEFIITYDRQVLDLKDEFLEESIRVIDSEGFIEETR